jgi:preprotein translocase SecE subunit
VAKTRAQRKAEQRRRAQQQGRTDADLTEESHAQHDTQVGETGYELEAELAERGVPLEELTGKVGAEAPPAPAPSRADVGVPAAEPEAAAADKIGRRAQRQAEKERKAKAKESERRRAPKVAAPAEKRQRGGVIGFFISCWAELKRVQWPDRETLIQASMITLVFITIMAAYLGVLDAAFNWLVQRIL